LGLECQLDALERVLKPYLAGVDEQPLARFAQQEELRHHLLADVSRHLLGCLGAEGACPIEERVELLLGKAQRQSGDPRPSEGQRESGEQCGDADAVGHGLFSPPCHAAMRSAGA
jgi:hypothetical protein